jgi:aconitase A
MKVQRRIWRFHLSQPEFFFKTSRKILNFMMLRGVPAVVDLAAMRDAMTRLGGDP